MQEHRFIEDPRRNTEKQEKDFSEKRQRTMENEECRAMG